MLDFPFGLVVGRKVVMEIGCFNPCCVGFSFWTRLKSGNNAVHSFNPCCVGFSFWTILAARLQLSSLRFQSLLCWIFLLDDELRSYGLDASCFNPCCVGFSFWTRMPPMGEVAAASFNPCCVGFSFWTNSRSPLLPLAKVFILVVLDFPFGPNAEIHH